MTVLVPVTAQVRRLVPTWCRPSIRKRTSLRRRAITPVPPPPTSRCCRRTKALLLARSATADVREVRKAAADRPDDVEAQLAVADVDMIGGQIEDAFSRLLDYLADGHTDQVEPVRERLLEYFMIPEATDERVKRARRRLATLMY